MSKCEKCQCNIKEKFGSGRFCSRSCANSRVKTEEIKKKTSESMKLAYREGRAINPFLVMSQEEIDNTIKKQKQSKLKALLNSDFDSIGYDSKRKVIIIEQKGKCNNCKLDEWMGEPIVLEIDHKDGINSNNTRENMVALCPNCHSLTHNWRGRNKKGAKKPPLRTRQEEIVRAYLKTKTIRQTLLELGMAAKGANYSVVKNALTKWGIKYD